MKTILVLMVVVSLLVPISANAQSTLALQEKCAEGAKKFFFERLNLYGGKWGSWGDEKGVQRNSYASHYNKKVEKCFIRIDYFHWTKGDKGQNTGHTIEVYNVFEGVLVGTSSSIRDEQLRSSSYWGIVYRETSPFGETCQSELIFESRIKPYMEE